MRRQDAPAAGLERHFRRPHDRSRRLQYECQLSYPPKQYYVLTRVGQKIGHFKEPLHREIELPVRRVSPERLQEAEDQSGQPALNRMQP